jgi:hypothetical protein
MATSTPIDAKKYGASYINDGVQGASPVFHNTYAIFDQLGFKSSEVGLQASFGRDEETEFWTNVFPSKVIDKYVLFMCFTSLITHNYLGFKTISSALARC